MGMIGYTRPLHGADDVTVDIEALRDAGAESVVVESSNRVRIALSTLIAECAEGDVVVVTSLDRLADQMTVAVRILLRLAVRQVELRCITAPDFDAGAAGVIVALRELDVAARRLTSRRTRAGMETSGKRPGRPSALTEQQVAMAVELRRLDRSHAHIARVLGVSTSTVQRALSR